MIGISFYFGYEIEPKERAKMIKNAGFESIMTNADKRLDKSNGSIRKQIHYLKKYNLKPSSLHMAYKTSELPNFWMDNKIGDKLEKGLIKDLKTAKKYGFNCVVVHLVGKYSEIGINRLKRILIIARKLNVYLAIENIDCQRLFVKVMDSIDDEYLKFCYDSGHNNAFDYGYPYLEKYGNRLITLHLHDNDGKADQHTLNRYGSIDWDKIASLLAICPKVNLDYELLFYKKCDLSPKEALEICYKQGKDLEKMIQEKRRTSSN
jgi:sugar phosphate isomerase/epimerase